MKIDRDALRANIAADPDLPCEAGAEMNMPENPLTIMANVIVANWAPDLDKWADAARRIVERRANEMARAQLDALDQAGMAIYVMMEPIETEGDAESAPYGGGP